MDVRALNPKLTFTQIKAVAFFLLYEMGYISGNVVDVQK